MNRECSIGQLFTLMFMTIQTPGTQNIEIIIQCTISLDMVLAPPPPPPPPINQSVLDSYSYRKDNGKSNFGFFHAICIFQLKFLCSLKKGGTPQIPPGCLITDSMCKEEGGGRVS